MSRVLSPLFLTALSLLAMSSCGLLSTAEAAGPWKDQIVDAETGQPLEGVVVLGYWIKYQASLAGWAGGKYYDSEEVVTGPDGRFVIQSRWTYTIPAFTKVSGPEWVIFKPGYGEWRSRGTGEGFDQGKEIVIELLPMKTREERLRFYRTLSWAPVVPPERTKSLDAVVKKERAYLGFRN